MSIDPPRVVGDHVTRLRHDLLAAGYTVDGVAAVLGPVAMAALDREQVLPALRATKVSAPAGAADDAGAAAILIRLFALGDPVDIDQAERALPTLGISGAAELGLLVPEGSGLAATCDLRPYSDGDHGWWVASDLSELATGSPLPTWHVLGIGGASTTLASWTPRPPVARALDLGTGSGVQALHLSTHAEAVVVTDLSERALAFAAFNAALNEVTWEQRRGSLLDPVAGRQFDLVVANPPFVITPRGGAVPRYDYRDGGAAGDTVVADLVRGLGNVLAPGGIAQLLGNWEVTAQHGWRERVGTWLAESGLDAWVVQREVADPAQYAETWARDGGHLVATADYDRMYAAWLDDFADRDVTGVGFGVITMHRPTTERQPFVDLVEVTHPVSLPMGPTIRSGIAARVWLAEHGDDEVLDTAWRAAPDVTVEHHHQPGHNDPRAIVVRQGGGLRLAPSVDTATAALIGVCDGELTARGALVAIADLLQEDLEQVTASVVPVLRSLVADGFVTR